MTKTIIHVVTNVSQYTDGHPTGLWLSELVHAWDVFAAAGYTQLLVSPKGGRVPLEPKSLAWLTLDSDTKAWKGVESNMALLEHTKSPSDIDISTAPVDAIYYTGGHATMYDFLDDAALQKLTLGIWEQGGVVSSVCHGYCGLLNLKLPSGEYLIKGKKMTGFSWNEECLAGVSGQVPYNAQEEAGKRGAVYEKNLLPFTSRVEVDGRLVTGQNPQSAKATAEKVVELLEAA
jgi:putative intracellular protease/amidase